MNGGTAAAGSLTSNGLFSQTLAAGTAAAVSQKNSNSVGFPGASNGGVNLLNYNYGASQTAGHANAQVDGQTNSANVSGTAVLVSADSQHPQQAHHSLIFQNQNGFSNQKQFTTSAQHHGLFPKIMNLRTDNQTVPNSAHSNGHVGGHPILQQPTSNQISSSATAAMNILKHSGGHISGMSTHQLPA